MGTKKLMCMLKKNFILLLSVLLIYFSYNLYKFSEGVNQDSTNNIKFHKNYIRSLPFEGLVIKKDICNDCDSNSFIISIKPDSYNFSDKKLQFKEFSNMYKISENEIFFTVNQNLFNKINKGDRIVNPKDSSLIKVNDKLLKW
ncbi:hypothetical protein AQ1689_200006 [Tenacibaculum maritimum]|nr:hypothetical protein AQ1689_200006 [Tenacibaculum maritimum]CAA0154766.1 hypothetical protein AQ1685_200006 [Tenacibaculum maritimum]CAA0155322.1 hypothetical protein AQ1688_200010 [Tenacibaculum maritimum]